MGKILELFQLFPILLIDHCNIHVPCYLYKGILSTFIHSTATLSQYTRTTNISCIIFRYSTQDVLNWDMQEYKRQHLLRKHNSSPFVTNKTWVSSWEVALSMFTHFGIPFQLLWSPKKAQPQQWSCHTTTSKHNITIVKPRAFRQQELVIWYVSGWSWTLVTIS